MPSPADPRRSRRAATLSLTDPRRSGRRSESPALLGALLARPPRRPDCRSVLLRGSAGSVASHGSRLAFVVLRQGMDTVQCVVHAGGDDSPGVSPGMVRFAASLAAESFVYVEGVVATPRAPVLRATAQHVEVRVRKIRCVARRVSPGLPFSLNDAAAVEEEEEELEGQGAGRPRVSQDTRFNHRVLDLRTPASQAIIRIEGQVENVSEL